MPINEQVRLWYAAKTADGQLAAVRRLVAFAAGEEDVPEWKDRARATSALIELLHLARHPADRVALIAQLGQCAEQFVAIPALHAEAQALDPSVRSAALHAIGRLGLPFGGSLVAGWLAERKPADEPAAVLEAALLALARTGHPAVGEAAESLWATGRLRAAVLHTSLADAVCPALADVARANLSDASLAVPAALHLSAIRIPDLTEALAPMLRSANLTDVLVEERLLALPELTPEDHLMEVMTLRGPIAAVGRAARGLRVHPPQVLADAYHLLAEDIDSAGWEGRRWVRTALLAGIPELQDVALDLAASASPRALVQALHHLCHPSPRLTERLDRWERSDDEALMAAAIRARVNIHGVQALPGLQRFADSPSNVARLEYVRAHQNALRDQRDPSGRTRLSHADRHSVASRIREALRSSEPDVQERAAFATGNIGLTDLAHELRGLLDLAVPWKVRRAAAVALSELPPGDGLEEIAGRVHDEPEASVRFRLIRVLLRAIQAGKPSSVAVMEAARRCARDEDAQVAVLAMVLRGASGDIGALGDLVASANSDVQARAAAAITALGSLGSTKAVPDLVRLTRHTDQARRRRAVEALGQIGDLQAALCLVSVFERESDPDVRYAAIDALTRCPAPPQEVHRLRPNGAEDPLMFELLQARMASAVGTQAPSASEIDARLTEGIAGFNASRLRKRSPEALRSLRTAEYLDSIGELPSGLDAAPPVLFWTKGIELWLNDVAAPLILQLREGATVDALDAAIPHWSGWRNGLPEAWIDPEGQNLWLYLVNGLAKTLSGRRETTLSLRDLATSLLVSGPLADRVGIGHWSSGLDDVGRTVLANRLTQLAWWRNPLTHRRAGTIDDVRRAREIALEAAALITRLE